MSFLFTCFELIPFFLQRSRQQCLTLENDATRTHRNKKSSQCRVCVGFIQGHFQNNYIRYTDLIKFGKDAA